MFTRSGSVEKQWVPVNVRHHKRTACPENFTYYSFVKPVDAPFDLFLGQPVRCFDGQADAGFIQQHQGGAFHAQYVVENPQNLGQGLVKIESRADQPRYFIQCPHFQVFSARLGRMCGQQFIPLFFNIVLIGIHA